jgi:hypothetical protein
MDGGLLLFLTFFPLGNDEFLILNELNEFDLIFPALKR